MKITVPEGNVWWQFECICGAVIEAEPADVISRPVYDNDFSQIGVTPIVACGRCGKQYLVPLSLITPMITKIAADHDQQKGARR